MYDPNYLQAEIAYRRQRIRDGIVGRRQRLHVRRLRAKPGAGEGPPAR